MKKEFIIFMVMAIGILATACSNESEDHESTADHADSGTKELTSEDSRSLNEADESGGEQKDNSIDQPEDDSSEDNAVSQADENAQEDRKVIYTANLRIEVKDYQETVDRIQTQVSERDGYIVESNMHESSEDGSISGRISARIPQDQFREFTQLVEEGSSDVVESSVSGQDVTEEYIDLESRLESKQVVEERLLSFMEQAEETEDLLKISDDLAAVQQEIEEITGRMNYLENKVDLATVTIQIEENDVSISSEEDLNTWEKTKQQFMKSINFLLSAFSGLFIFVAGNLPILIILAIMVIIVFWMIRKQRRDKLEE
ncbi:protein of unknown function [Lentibacillus halodurans]|uniref:DUF4349 domain-containing protein n=1 Tax=Lentibacillus halodurans TaxID=237679 RepID=A0A1I0ZBC1_9BACI|nr:DUF4349 domain-containing protein [Lentibacillus halodurans]SFB22821.1 protein of unknown function [Lentibacillus halodurans]